MGFDENARRAYAHFDTRVSYAAVKHQVENPDWVAKHGFFPLIAKTVVNKKYDGRDSKQKEREVAYASHVDRCVYQRYSFLLNLHYNVVAKKRSFNNASIAYRTNLGKSNIDFAMDAFQKMLECGECWVFVADFKDFFPSLDHALLKKRLALLFDDGCIPDDYYRVFKSVIHWSQWDIANLMKHNGLHPKKKSSLKRFNKLDIALSRPEFKKLVKSSVERPWLGKDAGIPQGLPVSGVLANVYMIEFDERMTELAKDASGAYMRYSDDVVLIAPCHEDFASCLDSLFDLCKSHALDISQDKTSSYHVRGGDVYGYVSPYQTGGYSEVKA